MADRPEREPVTGPITQPATPSPDPTPARPGGDEGVRRRGADVLAFPSLGVRRPPAPETAPEPRLRSVLGGVLRDERHEQGRTLADVAESASVSLPYLSEVERGTKEVSSDLLAAVCDALHIDLADLLERSAHRLRTRVEGGSGILALAA